MILSSLHFKTKKLKATVYVPIKNQVFPSRLTCYVANFKDAVNWVDIIENDNFVDDAPGRCNLSVHELDNIDRNDENGMMDILSVNFWFYFY